MTYGLQVFNASGRVQIDSEETYSNLFAGPPTTATVGTSITAGTDLIFARPTSGSGTIALEWSSSSSRDVALQQITYSRTSLMSGGAGNTGYGLTVINGGTVFTTENFNSNIDIIALGELTATNFTFTVTDVPSSQIYCLMNSTNYSVEGSREYKQTYTFSGTSIRVDNYSSTEGQLSAPGPMPYIIARFR